jgi:hypothetical protein
MVDSKVVLMRTAMVRKLEDMNLRSVLADEDNAKERLSIEIAIRHCDGISNVQYWSIAPVSDQIIEFRRSLKSWSCSYPEYLPHVRIITSLSDSSRLIEAPLQISASLDAWLENFWGLKGVRLSESPGHEYLLKCYRSAL